MQKLSQNEMKMIVGGLVTGCSASATCSGGGSISCSGYSVGSIGGCAATDAGYGGGGNGQVSCLEFIGGSFFPIYSSC